MSSFVDANVIIKAFTENKDKEKCRAVVNNGFTTNILCLAEAQDAIEAIKNDKVAASAFIRSLFGLNCRILDVNKNLLFASLRVHCAGRFAFFDSIHYATALLNNCSEIVSYNTDFDNLPIKRVEP